MSKRRGGGGAMSSLGEFQSKRRRLVLASQKDEDEESIIENMRKFSEDNDDGDYSTAVAPDKGKTFTGAPPTSQMQHVVDSQQESVSGKEHVTTIECSYKNDTREGAGGIQERKAEVGAFWAKQFMMPEWLVEIPEHLCTEWYVLPRPEGQRCLVIASHGRTIARLLSGVVMETFSSSLPNGGEGGGERESVLDCIYQPQQATFYVLDILCWMGHEIHNCTTEFRLFWRKSKFEEEYASYQNQVPKFCPLPAYQATPEGIRAAYTTPVPFLRDGLIFFHRHARYRGGQTPLLLTWKDSSTSRYFIDTDASGKALDKQHVILVYTGNGPRELITGDETPMPVATLPENFVASMGSHLKPGCLLRFTLEAHGGIQRGPSGEVWLQLSFVGIASQKRKRADTLSKIIFQNMARSNPITIHDLIEASTSIDDCDLHHP